MNLHPIIPLRDLKRYAVIALVFGTLLVLLACKAWAGAKVTVWNTRVVTWERHRELALAHKNYVPMWSFPGANNSPDPLKWGSGQLKALEAANFDGIREIAIRPSNDWHEMMGPLGADNNADPKACGDVMRTFLRGVYGKRMQQKIPPTTRVWWCNNNERGKPVQPKGDAAVLRLFALKEAQKIQGFVAPILEIWPNSQFVAYSLGPGTKFIDVPTMGWQPEALPYRRVFASLEGNKNDPAFDKDGFDWHLRLRAAPASREYGLPVVEFVRGMNRWNMTPEDAAAYVRTKTDEHGFGNDTMIVDWVPDDADPEHPALQYIEPLIKAFE